MLVRRACGSGLGQNARFHDAVILYFVVLVEHAVRLLQNGGERAPGMADEIGIATLRRDQHDQPGSRRAQVVHILLQHRR